MTNEHAGIPVFTSTIRCDASNLSLAIHDTPVIILEAYRYRTRLELYHYHHLTRQWFPLQM